MSAPNTAPSRPSRYTHHVPVVAGGALLFNAATGALAHLDDDAMAEYRALVTGGASGNAAAFLAGGFVVPTGTDELAAIRERYRAWQQDRAALSLTIATTLACNFACDYCYQDHAHRGHGMSGAVQEALLRWVDGALPGRRQFGVIWYGGEPLLCSEVIERLSPAFRERCADHGVPYAAGIVTNGFRLDGATAARLADLGVASAQVSLDGPPDEHDRRRHLRGHRGTFARILANLAEVAAGGRLGLVLRVNVDARNVAAAERLVDLLVAEGFAHRPGVQVAFARVTDPAGVGSPLWHQCLAPAEFAAEEARLLTYAQARGLARVEAPRPRGGACGAVRANSFVVAPDGALHKCWQTVADPAQAVGHVTAPTAIDDRRWLAWDPFQGACRTCAVLPACMGGCPSEAMRRGQTDPACPPVRYNLPILLQTVAARVGHPSDREGACAQ